MTSLLGRLHQIVFKRRIHRLAELFAAVLPQDAKVLDVGAGSGELAALVRGVRPDLEFTGIDVLVRPGTAIEVRPFDGAKIPFPDGSFDAVMFSDVLHHAFNVEELLAEAGRVAREEIILKDHVAETGMDRMLLRFMDWVGNSRYGVVLPYNYLSRERWLAAIASAGLELKEMKSSIGLYPFWYDWLFGGRLQTMIRLVPGRS